MTPQQFYDMLDTMDWKDPASLFKAEKLARTSVEFKTLHHTMKAYKEGTAQKPERPIYG